MNKFKFLHTADIHLGYRQFNNAQRFYDFNNSFLHTIEKAIECEVNAYIIAGDFFNKRNIDAETLMQAITGFQQLQSHSIPVLAIEGNHDKAFFGQGQSWLEFLSHTGYLKLLKPTITPEGITFTSWNEATSAGGFFDIKNIRFYGAGYLGATTNQRVQLMAESLEPDSRFNVLMLHATMERFGDQDFGRVSKEALEHLRDKVQYVALGHSHKAYSHDNWAFSPGALENWDLREATYKHKGFYIVTVSDKGCETELIESKRRPVLREVINIAETQNPPEAETLILNRLESKLDATVENPILQIIIQGDVDYTASEINTGYLNDKLTEMYQPLLVDIVNHANQLSIESSHDDLTMDRRTLERLTVEQLYKRKGKYGGFEDELARLTLAFKDHIATQGAAMDMMEEVRQLALKIYNKNKVEEHENPTGHPEEH